MRTIVWEKNKKKNTTGNIEKERRIAAKKGTEPQRRVLTFIEILNRVR